MAVDIKIPSAGESITEGTIARWFKPNGAAVKANEPVLELETDKATMEVIAPAAGVLNITVPEGTKVAIGSVVGRIEPGPVSAAPKGADGAKARAAAPSAPEKKEKQEKEKPEKEEQERVAVSPAARQLAADEGVDVRQLTGTGRGGVVLKEDVLAHLSGLRTEKGKAAPPGPPSEAPAAPPPLPKVPAAAPPVPPGQRETRQRMSTIRQRIAERLLAAQQQAAILTTFNEADLSAVLALRAKYKESFQKKHGVGLGFMSFFVKAVIEGLKAFPVINARIDGPDIVFYHHYDIGVAVSTERGLMVPVLRDADKLSFAGIEKAIADLAQKARDNKISVTDLQGGTFTITNGGVFGSLLSTPILNPPQSGILGMHTIQKRPVVVDDQIVVRPMMYLAFSYDHRLIDGREAVSFLVRVKECIESPDRMLLEV
jgi:2-oxoglutarate dehydrogenase E2 component (dihydrolipoamide succinyltransferase)